MGGISGYLATVNASGFFVVVVMADVVTPFCGNSKQMVIVAVNW